MEIYNELSAPAKAREAPPQPYGLAYASEKGVIPKTI